MDTKESKITPSPMIKKETNCTLGKNVINPFAIGIKRIASVKMVLNTLPR